MESKIKTVLGSYSLWAFMRTKCLGYLCCNFSCASTLGIADLSNDLFTPLFHYRREKVCPYFDISWDGHILDKCPATFFEPCAFPIRISSCKHCVCHETCWNYATNLSVSFGLEILLSNILTTRHNPDRWIWAKQTRCKWNLRGHPRPPHPPWPPAGFTSWKSSKKTRHMALKTKAQASHGFLIMVTNHPFVVFVAFQGDKIVQNGRPWSSWWCPKQSPWGSSMCAMVNWVLFP